MLQKLSWVSVLDGSQAEWVRIFHLYGGFKRRSTSSGYYIKGSVRAVQPPAVYYKGFTIKYISKGVIVRALITKQSFFYLLRSGLLINSTLNTTILLKNKFTFISKYIYGGVYSLIKKKKTLFLFKDIL